MSARHHGCWRALRRARQALELPSYFGRNWDALWDLLTDLSWLAARRIIIVHAELPLQPTEQQRTYVGLLHDAVMRWSQRPDSHELTGAFPVGETHEVGSLLSHTGSR